MRTVTVTGRGEALVVPDSALVRVAAVHHADGVADALAGADSAAARIVATAADHTAREQIGTASIHIRQHYDKDGDPSGFAARHSLTIRCTDVASAGAMLSALAEQVGDRLELDGVSLEVADPTDGVRAAREAAYADAVERGRHLAALAGAELGEPQEVAEDGGGTPRRAMAVLESAHIEPGETAIGASVTVTFQLL